MKAIQPGLHRMLLQLSQIVTLNFENLPNELNGLLCRSLSYQLICDCYSFLINATEPIGMATENI